MKLPQEVHLHTWPWLAQAGQSDQGGFRCSDHSVCGRERSRKGLRPIKGTQATLMQVTPSRQHPQSPSGTASTLTGLLVCQSLHQLTLQRKNLAAPWRCQDEQEEHFLLM